MCLNDRIYLSLDKVNNLVMTKYAKVSTIKFLSRISYDPTICGDTRNPDSLQEVQINMQLMYSVDLGPTFDKSQTGLEADTDRQIFVDDSGMSKVVLSNFSNCVPQFRCNCN